MMNQYMLVGRVVSITSYGIKIKSHILVDGKPDHEIVIPIYISSKMLDNCKQYLGTDDLCGVRGHFDVNEKGSPIIIGDKITFLSSKKLKEEENGTSNNK